MRLLYSAADICAVPSLQEAFGLVCAEAQRCGLTCIAFEDTGLADLILHKKQVIWQNLTTIKIFYLV
jgi:glycosyltransferase involved in cell wall biosynthesis